MSCDRPGVVYTDGDDGMLWLGCSACDQDYILGEVALVREVLAAERRHHGLEPGLLELGLADE